MRHEVTNLMEATGALLKFIDENSVYDEMANDGDGYLDTWMSSSLSELIAYTQEKLDELKEVANDT